MTLSNQIAQSSKQAEEEAQIRHVINNLEAINRKLGEADPTEIIEWAIDNLPGLYQTTAFGITGCITVDMISRISEQRAAKQGVPAKHLVPLIFVDTLYHFPQTLDLAHKAAKHYNAEMYTYYPPGTKTVREFEDKWGPQLWEKDEETYDYLVKVEPARRSYEELGVRAVFTGRTSISRCRSCLAQRCRSRRDRTRQSQRTHELVLRSSRHLRQKQRRPYNELLDLGYKSIGDWHSTSLPRAGDTASVPAGGRTRRARPSAVCTRITSR